MKFLKIFSKLEKGNIDGKIDNGILNYFSVQDLIIGEN